MSNTLSQQPVATDNQWLQWLQSQNVDETIIIELFNEFIENGFIESITYLINKYDVQIDKSTIMKTIRTDNTFACELLYNHSINIGSPADLMDWDIICTVLDTSVDMFEWLSATIFAHKSKNILELYGVKMLQYLIKTGKESDLIIYIGCNNDVTINQMEKKNLMELAFLTNNVMVVRTVYAAIDYHKFDLNDIMTLILLIEKTTPEIMKFYVENFDDNLNDETVKVITIAATHGYTSQAWENVVALLTHPSSAYEYSDNLPLILHNTLGEMITQWVNDMWTQIRVHEWTEDVVQFLQFISNIMTNVRKIPGFENFKINLKINDFAISHVMWDEIQLNIMIKWFNSMFVCDDLEHKNLINTIIIFEIYDKYNWLDIIWHQIDFTDNEDVDTMLHELFTKWQKICRGKDGIHWLSSKTNRIFGADESTSSYIWMSDNVLNKIKSQYSLVDMEHQFIEVKENLVIESEHVVNVDEVQNVEIIEDKVDIVCDADNVSASFDEAPEFVEEKEDIVLDIDNGPFVPNAPPAPKFGQTLVFVEEKENIVCDADDVSASFDEVPEFVEEKEDMECDVEPIVPVAPLVPVIKVHDENNNTIRIQVAADGSVSYSNNITTSDVVSDTSEDVSPTPVVVQETQEEQDWGTYFSSFFYETK